MTSYGKLEAAIPLDNSVSHSVFGHHCHLRACNRNYGAWLCADGMTELNSYLYRPVYYFGTRRLLSAKAQRTHVYANHV